MFSCTSVFHTIEKCKAKIIILQGGTSSSKSYSAMQLGYLRAIQNPKSVITVTGESLPNLRKGIYRDAEAIYGNSKYLQNQVLSWNKTDRIILFKNGSIIEFNSNLDEQSAKAGKRDLLIVDEAQGITWPIFFQLAIRTRGQVFILYNPTAPFWSHEKLIGTKPETNDLSATVQLYISDHRHNCFLSNDEHAKIENIKDPELHRVYARGLTGNLTGLIYTNWTMIPDSEFLWDSDNKFGGLDFGYTNDPTAGVHMTKQGNKIFIHELCYANNEALYKMSGGTEADKIIKSLFTNMGYTPDDPIYCEHDSDMIRALRKLELLAVAARKGANSINPGITKVKEYEIFFTESSRNIDYERKKYMWMVDPATNKPINTPIDKDNHLMDAIRYGIYTHFFRSE
jgi:phage terminase large subunit